MISHIFIFVLFLFTSIPKANTLFKEDSEGNIFYRPEVPKWNGYDKTFLWKAIDPKSSKILRKLRSTDGIHGWILRSL